MKPLLNPLNLALLAALVVAAAVGFVVVPAGQALPVHWGISGAADSFAPRELALLMPLVIAAIVWGVFLLLPRFAKPGDLEAGRHTLGVALAAVTALALLIEVALVLIGVGIAVAMVQVIALALGAMMIALGNALPKSHRNSVAGLRLPSTLRDPANWQATHRLTGFLAVGGGVLLIIVALVAPASALVWWVLACVLVPFAVGTVYSIAFERGAAARPKGGRRH